MGGSPTGLTRADQHPGLPRTKSSTSQRAASQGAGGRSLRAAGVVEPEAPESELERIEQYLMAEPFEPFVIEMAGGKSFRIERRDRCGFNRHGSVQCTGSTRRGGVSSIQLTLSG